PRAPVRISPPTGRRARTRTIAAPREPDREVRDWRGDRPESRSRTPAAPCREWRDRAGTDPPLPVAPARDAAPGRRRAVAEARGRIARHRLPAVRRCGPPTL